MDGVYNRYNEGMQLQHVAAPILCLVKVSALFLAPVDITSRQVANSAAENAIS